MRAVVYDRYGPPARLRLAATPVPVPRTGQVLVEVVATSVNLSDWEALLGSPTYARMGGLRRPARQVLGSDIAGRVAAVGPGVEQLRVGDEVFGDILQRKGGFAEYAIAAESELAPKPASLSFVEAAALPQSGAITHHALRWVSPGARMLINGAGGGTGSLMIQAATAAGARVTGVDSADKLAFMRSLSADAVLDYRETDFTRTGPYDFVVDLVASRSVRAYRRSLAHAGRYLMVGGTTRALIRLATLGPLVGVVTGSRLGVMFVNEGPRWFGSIAQACVDGDIRVVIDRTFGLEDVPAALAYHGAGRALGKVVVTVRPE